MEEKSNSLSEESGISPLQNLLDFLTINLRKIISVGIGAFVVIFLILLIITIAKSGAPFKTTKSVTIGQHTFKTSVAITEAQKEIGLSETKNLPSDYAMIFPFDQEGYYSFWMKNMKFPIDIIYINGNKIVKIFSNVAPPQKDEGLKIYVSDSPADKVLEIKAGVSDKYKIKQGDTITLKDI